ncbi:MAG: hypothetical protein J5J00_03085 [Deltaproteobacteria bacterium]|nr:hypothetical protein [Deltaproteobacteria bacterium]
MTISIASRLSGAVFFTAAAYLSIAARVEAWPRDISGPADESFYVGLNGKASEVILTSGSRVQAKGRVVSRDTRPFGLIVSGPQGTKVAVAARMIPNGSRGATRSKRSNPRAWHVPLLAHTGEIGSELEVPADGILAAAAFLSADACAGRRSYEITATLSAPHYGTQTSTVIISMQIGAAPSSQQTLFKFPSEKFHNQAVLLMRTNVNSHNFINIVQWKRGQPRVLHSRLVDGYFFSGLSIFTRLYLPSVLLTGKRVTFEHLSADFDDVYAVCGALKPLRQQLEGYGG